MPLLICYVLRFSTPCAEWDDLAILLAGAFPGVTCHSFKRTRVGRVPTSYPTASTRRWMCLAANARTDPKVYVDCHEDYRISATIYTNRLSKSRGFQFIKNYCTLSQYTTLRGFRGRAPRRGGDGSLALDPSPHKGDHGSLRADAQVTKVTSCYALRSG